MVVDDAGFAGGLRQSLLEAIADGAEQLRRERWRDQPWATRAFTRTRYELARLLTGVFAMGRSEEFT